MRVVVVVVPLIPPRASQGTLVVKNLPASAGDIRDMGVAWQPTPVFLAGESHGQKNKFLLFRPLSLSYFVVVGLASY